MSELKLNDEFLERIKELKFKYEGKIPEGLHYYYMDVLDGKNIEMLMETYSLSKEKLIEYARVCKMIGIYKEIFELIEMIKSEVELNNTELEEYQQYIDALQREGTSFLNDVESSLEDDDSVDVNDNNLFIYPSCINESIEKTLNAHSGKEEQTQKSVATLIEQLSKIDYQSFRKKGLIHQVVEVGVNKPCYIDGNAYERITRNATKLSFFRVPVNEKNREAIKKTFKIDFDTIYLIVSFGDFLNEGINEKLFYSKTYSLFKRNINEITNILNLFKNDFTAETLPIAMKIINDGFKMTDDLTDIIKSKQSSI